MSGGHTVVLVEGASDKSAIEALAKRRGRNLAAEGISLVAMSGATNIATYIGRYGPTGRNLQLAGLCDVGEEGDFRRALERATAIVEPRPPTTFTCDPVVAGRCHDAAICAHGTARTHAPTSRCGEADGWAAR